MGFDKGYYDRCCCCLNCITAQGHLAFGIITILASIPITINAISTGIVSPFWYLILGILTCVSYCRRDDNFGKGRVSFALCVYIFSIITLIFDYGIYLAMYALLD